MDNDDNDGIRVQIDACNQALFMLFLVNIIADHLVRQTDGSKMFM